MKIKVKGSQLIRVGNAPYTKREPGETEGDVVHPIQITGSTLNGITVVDGEIIFHLVGRME